MEDFCSAFRKKFAGMFYGLGGRCHGKIKKRKKKKSEFPRCLESEKAAIWGPLIGREGLMNRCLIDSEVPVSVAARPPAQSGVSPLH